jgi:hypothetical protein
MFSDPIIKELEMSGMDKMLKQAGALSENSKNEVFNYLHELRLDNDFEYFGNLAMKITDKVTKQDVNFQSRLPQRKLIAEYERQRVLDKPIRVDLLKARQWGGSTATQLYMSWIQLRLKTKWHSVICADIEDQSKNIASMFERIAKEYPPELGKVTLAPYARSSNRIFKERGAILSIGSAQKPDKVRSFDNAMAHLSEIGIWKKTAGKSPEKLVSSLVSSIYPSSHSFICKESTAKGVGSYWHQMCLDSMEGKSGYSFVFIPWCDVDMYTRPIEDYKKFIQSMSEYDKFQWECGATLEGINYYRTFKSDEKYSDWDMQEEYPTTPEEAFQSTGRRAFEPMYVLQCRKAYTLKPWKVGLLKSDSRSGKECLDNIHFIEDHHGDLKIWGGPDTSIKVAHRYVVAMDIGGKNKKADKTVLSVLDRYWLLEGGLPEFVADWTFNMDQDLSAWRAAMISKWYNNALLAIEWQSLKKSTEENVPHSQTILDTIVDFYPNLYSFTSPEKIKQGLPVQYGFFTGKNKQMLIDNLNAGLRDMVFIEHDHIFFDECDSYEEKPDGRYGAVLGAHDDKVMSRAIALEVSKKMPMPYIIKETYTKGSTRISNEASF